MPSLAVADESAIAHIHARYVDCLKHDRGLAQNSYWFMRHSLAATSKARLLVMVGYVLMHLMSPISVSAPFHREILRTL